MRRASPARLLARPLWPAAVLSLPVLLQAVLIVATVAFIQVCICQGSKRQGDLDVTGS